MLDPNYRKAGDSLEVCNVQCCDTIAEMQRCRANEQILESNRNTTRGLFTLDATGKLRDFHVHRVHHRVTPEFLAKGSPPLAVSIAFGPVDAVG